MYFPTVIWTITREIYQEIATIPEVRTPPQCPVEKRYEPFHLCNKLITWACTSPATGHSGSHCTHQVFQVEYWWPSRTFTSSYPPVLYVPKPKYLAFCWLVNSSLCLHHRNHGHIAINCHRSPHVSEPQSS